MGTLDDCLQFPFFQIPDADHTRDPSCCQKGLPICQAKVNLAAYHNPIS
jgi:hypothetical protein